jgi:uncharacterized protein (TIGR03083 family)
MNHRLNGQSGLIDPKLIMTAHLFPEILDRLIQLLSELDEECWASPTACPGWSVKDVALHLLGVEIGNLSSRRDGHVLGGPILEWEQLVAHVNRWNHEWVTVARRISSPVLIDLLEFLGGQASRYFQSLDPFEIGGAISWAGPEPRPVWLEIAREYTERWHHQQHIRDAVDRPGLKAPRYFHPVLATFAWAMPHAFRNLKASEGTRVTLNLAGDSGGSWTIAKKARGWRLYQGRARDPDALILLDQELAWRFFTRGLTAHAAQRETSIEGERALAEPFFGMVSIIA